MGFELEKLTDQKWLNLYNVVYDRADNRRHTWVMCSRKSEPVKAAGQPDAVFIVPILHTPDGVRLVMTREFRVPIWDYEYGFPAGLIDEGETVETTTVRELKEETGLDVRRILHTSMPVYSSAGMSDESCVMVLLEADGTASNDYLQPHEQIETILMDVDDIQNLLRSGARVAAKAWGLLYHFAATGKIGFDFT